MNVLRANIQFTKSLTPLFMHQVEHIVIHHLKAKIATPEDIHRWHLNNGWIGAGYNEYIKKDGTVYIMRGDNVGAHTKGYNDKSYGIALEGDYDVETEMPELQLRSLIERIQHNKNKFKKAEVVGHGKLTNTSCPGNNFDLSLLEDKEENHWAESICNTLIDKYGLTIHEKRFDDTITRAETMALILQALESINKLK